MAGRLENGITLEAVAVSAYNAFCYAQGATPKFEHLSLEDTARWANLANKAEGAMAAFEGKPVDVAAAEVLKIWSRGTMDFKKQPVPWQLYWSAVTRHLATLVDAEEIPDLAGLERSWREWVEARMAKAVK